MEFASIEELFFTYITTPFAIFTSLVLALSVFVLGQIKDALLFTYLKLEILFALLYSLIIIGGIIIKCPKCFPNMNLFAVCAYRYYVFNYLLSVAETTSILMGILAALSLFSILDSSKNCKLAKCFLKIKPNLAALVAFGFSALLFLFEALVPLPTTINDNSSNNSSIHECIWIENFVDAPRSIFLITSLLTSYGLLVVALVVVNAFIVVRVRRSLLGSIKSDVLKNSAAAKRRTVEQKLTILIVTDCFNLVAGRFPCFVLISIYIILGPTHGFYFPFASVSNFIFLLSLNFKFVLLFQLNIKFRMVTRRVLSCFWFCRRKF